MYIEYRGFVAKITPDIDSNNFFGEVIHQHPMLFHGKTLNTLVQAFKDTVETYLAHQGTPVNNPLITANILSQIDLKVS